MRREGGYFGLVAELLADEGHQVLIHVASDGCGGSVNIQIVQIVEQIIGIRVGLPLLGVDLFVRPVDLLPPIRMALESRIHTFLSKTTNPLTSDHLHENPSLEFACPSAT